MGPWHSDPMTDAQGILPETPDFLPHSLARPRHLPLHRIAMQKENVPSEIMLNESGRMEFPVLRIKIAALCHRRRNHMKRRTQGKPGELKRVLVAVKYIVIIARVL